MVELGSIKRISDHLSTTFAYVHQQGFKRGFVREEIQHVVDAHVETICDDICVSSTSHISQHGNKNALGRTGNHMRLNI